MHGIKLVLGLKAMEELTKELEKAKRSIRRNTGNIRYDIDKILLLLIECQIANYKVKMKKEKKNKKNNKGEIYT